MTNAHTEQRVEMIEVFYLLSFVKPGWAIGVPGWTWRKTREYERRNMLYSHLDFKVIYEMEATGKCVRGKGFFALHT